MLFSNIQPNKNKILTWGIVTILLASSTSCGVPTITIEEISRYKNGKIVHVKGKVTQTAPFINTAAYQLDDGTGTVWVVTPHQPPKLKQLAIEGEIRYQSLPIAQQEFGEFYLIEQERLDPDEFSQ